MTQTVLLRRGLSGGMPVLAASALPWLDWGVLVRLDDAGPAFHSLRGGEAAGWEDGLEGEGDGRVARLREGPGCGGKPERQMSFTQHEARGGSGWVGGDDRMALRWGPGWGGNPERQMSHTQHEAGGWSGWARWSPCRSRTQAQCLSTRGLSLRRWERRRRPSPPRQSASRQRESLWAGLRATHRRRGVSVVRRRCRGQFRSLPPFRQPGGMVRYKQRHSTSRAARSAGDLKSSSSLGASSVP